MAKKKKSSGSQSFQNSGILEDIIEHLVSIKECGGLVVGTNAVLRGIEKKSVDVAILITNRASSSMFHALKLMCKKAGGLFFQYDDCKSALNSQIRASTTYGIKIEALLDNDKFSKIVSRIKNEIEFLKAKAAKKSAATYEKLRALQVHQKNSDNMTSVIKLLCPTYGESNCGEYNPHKKHTTMNPKRIGKAETFISLKNYSISETAFPNYKTGFAEIKFCINQLETNSEIVKMHI